MNTLQAWDAAYRGQTHLSQWPWSDVVSLFHRHVRSYSASTRVLELGCGAGANIPFFLALGVEYHALEGSSIIVNRLKERFPVIAARIHYGDFSAPWPGYPEFDVIIDRASITHNPVQAIRRILSQCAEHLNSGGKLISVDWFSSAHTSAGLGSVMDSHTRTGIETGHLANLGPVNFADRSLLEGMIKEAGLQLRWLEHKENRILVPDAGEIRAWWNLVAEKP
jgi:SAM-dependent methyltransferase